MKTFNAIYLLAIILITSSCTKLTDGSGILWAPNNYEPMEKKEIIYNYPEAGDSIYKAADVLTIDSDVLYIYSPKNNSPSKVVKRKGPYARKIWTWKANYAKEITDFHIYEEKLILKTEDEITVINTQTGQTIWSKNINSLFPNFSSNDFITVNKGAIFFSVVSNSGTTAKIISLDLQTHEHTSIYTTTTYENNNRRPILSNPSIFKDANDDEIIAFYQKSDVDYMTSKELIAYNTTTNIVVWRKEIGTDESILSELNPIYFDGKIYTTGKFLAASYNSEDGSLEWRTELTRNTMSNGLNITLPLIYEDKIFINVEGSRLSCLNIYTGEHIWTADYPSGRISRNMKIYKEAIYYRRGSAGLTSHNINDGKRIIDQLTLSYDVNVKKNFSIAIDTEKGYLYTSNPQVVICYNLNE